MYIKKNNLLIRKALITDAEILGKWWRDGKIMAHAGFPLGLKITDQEIISDLAKDTKDNQRLIIEINSLPAGEMSYRRKEDNIAEIGIKICDFNMQNKGFGQIAIKSLIMELFESYGYQKIILDTNLENLRAQNVYEKIGFQKVGIRYDCWKDQLGKFQSAVDYEMTKANYELLKK